MKLIVDQQLPPLLAAWLRERGVDAVHVRYIALKDSPDLKIWAHAQAQRAVVVTRDADFEQLVHGQAEARLIWVRVGNCSNPELIALFERRWPWISEQLQRGAMVVEVRS